MIEITIRNHLTNSTDGLSVPVLMEQPKNPPSEYVILRLADSGRINYIDAATFFITVTSDTLYNAAVLRDQVKDLLFDAIRLDSVSNVTFGGENASIDSANRRYVYDLTFNFYYYREET